MNFHVRKGDNLINNPKMFNGETDDLAAKPYTLSPTSQG